MKKIIGILCVLLPLCAHAKSSVHLDNIDVDVFDKASLRRGANTYVKYCLGCHSLKHMRYSRIAADLEMSEESVKKELIYVGENIHDSMMVAMGTEQAEAWFGIKAPDLSLISRSRGKDWIYSYLRGFYIDKSRPFGVNNIVFKDVGMPNVLWELQGSQDAVYKTHDGVEVFARLVSSEEGRLSKRQFDTVVADLVNFLEYVGEPAQLIRLKMGKWVILYLLIFWLVAYRLKAEYWKDVH